MEEKIEWNLIIPTMNNKSVRQNGELEEKIHFLQVTLDHVDTYIFTKDLEGRYTYANEKVRELFDCSLNEVIGYDDSKFFALEQSNDLRENDQIVMQEGKVVDKEELNVLVSTGETRYYRTIKKPLLSPEGAIVGMIGVSTDITQNKKIEAELQRSEEVLRVLAESGTNNSRNIFQLIVEQLAVS